jgi:hypothetical protein
MSPDLSAFLKNTHAHFLTALSRKLAQSDRSSQAGRASPDDDDIEFHRFTFDGAS